MSNFEWLKPLAAASFGWVLANLSQYIVARGERRRAISKALSDLLEIRIRLLGVSRGFDEIKKAIQLPPEAEFQLRAFVRQILPFNSDQLSRRYDESVSLVAAVDPILGYRLRSKDLLQPLLQNLDAAVAQDAQAVAFMQPLRALMLKDAETEFNEEIKYLSWKLGPITRWRTGSLLKSSRANNKISELMALVRKELQKAGAAPSTSHAEVGAKMKQVQELDKMKQNLKEHLIRCEGAVQAAKPILGKHHFPDDYRTVTVIGFISTVIEHQESALLLVLHEKFGSAFTMTRPIVEGAYRGLWINACASDEEIKKFNEQDKIDLTFGQIAEALDPAHNTGDFFQDFKARSWTALNSFTHGGMLQLGRRFTKHEVSNNYSDGEIYEMTTTGTTCVLILISRFLAKQGHAADAKAIDDLLETYGPVFDGKKK